MQERISESTIPEETQEEIKELISVCMLLPRVDRAVILANANVLRVRNDIEKSKMKKDGMKGI